MERGVQECALEYNIYANAMEEPTTPDSGDAPEKAGWTCPVSSPNHVSHIECHIAQAVSASEGVLSPCVPEDGLEVCEDGDLGAPCPDIRLAGQGDVRAAWVNVGETCEDGAGRPDTFTAFAPSWRDRCVTEEPTRVYTLSDHPGAPPCHCPPLPSTDIPDGDPEVVSYRRTHYGCTESPGCCPLETIPERDEQMLSGVFTIPVEDYGDQPLEDDSIPVEDYGDQPLEDDSCIVEMRILQKTEPLSVTSLTQGPHLAKRCDSTLSTASEKLDICRICHCEGEETNKLISPCLCSGSLKFIHLTCLQKWIKSSDKKSCELCNFEYVMTTKTKPFKQWEKLTMTSAERRKIICSVTFHIIAITCVIWSLYVLIDRSTEEVHSGSLDWPFWTKLIVVAIGFTGGLVFMYVQCKMYVQLCFRWRQFNKIITVENAPEDPQFRVEAAARIKAKSGEKTGVVNPVALQEVDSF